MPVKALVPVDTTRNSKTAEAHAVKLARKTPLEIVLLHVVDTKTLDGHGLDPGLKESILDKKRVRAEKILAEAAEAFEKANVPVQKRLLNGDPAPLICYTAKDEDVDMVVIAESGMSEFQDWFMGSVTNYVLYRSPVPVLLVKHHHGS
jgi:nucleotide-binding universal stress UspA family protein